MREQFEGTAKSVDEALRREIQAGTECILDKGYTNESMVKVVSQTPGRLYSEVTDGNGASWEVMTVRLIPKHLDF